MIDRNEACVVSVPGVFADYPRYNQGIRNCNTRPYNFDETGFQMGVVGTAKVMHQAAWYEGGLLPQDWKIGVIMDGQLMRLDYLR